MMSDEVRGKVVMMGSSIFAGIDRHHVEEIPMALVLEFSDRESLRAALNGVLPIRAFLDLDEPTNDKHSP